MTDTESLHGSVVVELGWGYERNERCVVRGDTRLSPVDDDIAFADGINGKAARAACSRMSSPFDAG